MDFTDFIQKIDEHSVQFALSYKIILTANVRQQNGQLKNFYFDEADISEQFSKEEFLEISNGITAAGFIIEHVYYSELDLIADIINNKIRVKDYIIYNLIRNGHFYARKSLMPAFLEFLHLPYSCSNSLTVSLCRNKYYVMKMLESHGMKVPTTMLLNKDSLEYLPDFTYPVIVKDIMGAASTHLTNRSIIQPSKESKKQIAYLYNELNQDLVIQEFIDGYECEVPIFVYGDQIICMDAIGIAIMGDKNPNSKILTYENSYNYNYNFFLMSDVLSPQALKKIYDMAIYAAKILKIKVYGRIDFRVTKEGDPYIIDISTTPYTIRHSSFAYAFQEKGLAYEKIYQSIIVNTIFNDRL